MASLSQYHPVGTPVGKHTLKEHTAPRAHNFMLHETVHGVMPTASKYGSIYCNMYTYIRIWECHVSRKHATCDNLHSASFTKS